ncbi:ATP-dependent DNA helicase RecG [Bosea sp. Tri-44]|nr:ATP-dependent DNA helicase RecG [Bosea sp. Tri-44]
MQPSKLTKTISALANADGGDIFVGISESKNRLTWDGFDNEEAANAHSQVIEQTFPLGANSRVSFLHHQKLSGLVLFIEIEKTPDIRKASDGIAYLRRGAQSLPQTTNEQILRLSLNKGIHSYEDHSVNNNIEFISNFEATRAFMSDVVPFSTAEDWLRKQKLAVDGKPTVAGVMLFSDEPQIELPKGAIKVYRYKTNDASGTRDTLAFDPLSIEGNAYSMIYKSVDTIRSIIESIPIAEAGVLSKLEYPTEAIHEIITNAVIHRDYIINDDIHVRIFDNRIEVQSPGTLAGHVTTKNILDERFARNPKIVRLLNKFKNPPNKDVGEGLNTAFEAMRKLKLKDPIVEQKDNGLLVLLRHEKLAAPQQLIIDFLRSNEEINNRIAREICFIGSENKVKLIFKDMIKSDVIERIPNRSQSKAAYRKGASFPT